jgi:hypothetical protein
MSRETDRTEALRRELVAGIVQQTGMREVLAVPIATSLLAYLQAQYGGERLYIPQPCRQFDMLQIEAALRAGEHRSRRAGARHHGASIASDVSRGACPRLQTRPNDRFWQKQSRVHPKT